MDDEKTPAPLLPELPELRDVALAMESAGMIGEVLDSRFRTVFVSSRMVRLAGMNADEVKRQYGRSLIIRSMREDSDIVRVEHESGRDWFFHNAPSRLPAGGRARRRRREGRARRRRDPRRRVVMLQTTDRAQRPKGAPW